MYLKGQISERAKAEFPEVFRPKDVLAVLPNECWELRYWRRGDLENLQLSRSFLDDF